MRKQDRRLIIGLIIGATLAITSLLVYGMFIESRTTQLKLGSDGTTVEALRNGDVIWESQPGDDGYSTLRAILDEGDSLSKRPLPKPTTEPAS